MPRQALIQRKDGRYECRYDGKHFYGKSKTEALRKRDDYIQELNLGFKPDMAETRFDQYAMKWLSVYRKKSNPKMKRLYESMIEYASCRLHTYIRCIIATDIQDLFNQLEGKSQSYISKFCATIRGIFRAAVRDGVIIRNPAEDLETPKPAEIHEHRCLDQWEQQLIVDTYKEHDFGLCAMVMMFAGLRRGEALYIDIDRDVDFEKNLIQVQGAISYCEGIHGTVSEGKTKAAKRTIPMSSILSEALKGHHGLLVSKQDGSIMSLSSFVRKYESYLSFLEYKANGCYKRWYGKTKAHKQLLSEGKALPPWKDVHIRCHDFRVTFCTVCYNAGISIKTLQAWMGHTDADMIMKIYAKLTAEKERYDTSKLDAYTQSRFLRQ